MKQTKCHECWGLNGHHWASCARRGYANVGPHPDAPARDTERPPADAAEQEMCCGGTCVRALCPYHGDLVKAAAESCESDSWGDPADPNNPLAFHPADFTRREVTACGNYVQTFRDGKVVDEEPIEAYGIAAHMPPARIALLNRNLDLWQHIVSGPGVFIYDSEGAQIEMPEGSVISFVSDAPAAFEVKP